MFKKITLVTLFFTITLPMAHAVTFLTSNPHSSLRNGGPRLLTKNPMLPVPDTTSVAIGTVLTTNRNFLERSHANVQTAVNMLNNVESNLNRIGTALEELQLYRESNNPEAFQTKLAEIAMLNSEIIWHGISVNSAPDSTYAFQYGNLPEPKFYASELSWPKVLEEEALALSSFLKYMGDSIKISNPLEPLSSEKIINGFIDRNETPIATLPLFKLEKETDSRSLLMEMPD